MSAPLVKCPTCGRSTEWSEASPFRPFCSERCKLIDLGAWLSEQRGIPGDTSPPESAEGPAGKDPGAGIEAAAAPGAKSGPDSSDR